MLINISELCLYKQYTKNNTDLQTYERKIITISSQDMQR